MAARQFLAFATFWAYHQRITDHVSDGWRRSDILAAGIDKITWTRGDGSDNLLSI